MKTQLISANIKITKSYSTLEGAIYLSYSLHYVYMMAEKKSNFHHPGTGFYRLNDNTDFLETEKSQPILN